MAFHRLTLSTSRQAPTWAGGTLSCPHFILLLFPGDCLMQQFALYMFSCFLSHVPAISLIGLTFSGTAVSFRNAGPTFHHLSDPWILRAQLPTARDSNLTLEQRRFALTRDLLPSEQRGKFPFWLVLNPPNAE